MRAHAVRIKEGLPLYEHRRELFDLIKLLLDPLGIEVLYQEWGPYHPQLTAMDIEPESSFGIAVVMKENKGKL